MLRVFTAGAFPDGYLGEAWAVAGQPQMLTLQSATACALEALLSAASDAEGVSATLDDRSRARLVVGPPADAAAVASCLEGSGSSALVIQPPGRGSGDVVALIVTSHREDADPATLPRRGVQASNRLLRRALHAQAAKAVPERVARAAAGMDVQDGTPGAGAAPCWGEQAALGRWGVVTHPRWLRAEEFLWPTLAPAMASIAAVRGETASWVAAAAAAVGPDVGLGTLVPLSVTVSGRSTGALRPARRRASDRVQLRGAVLLSSTAPDAGVVGFVCPGVGPELKGAACVAGLAALLAGSSTPRKLRFAVVAMGPAGGIGIVAEARVCVERLVRQLPHGDAAGARRACLASAATASERPAGSRKSYASDAE